MSRINQRICAGCGAKITYETLPKEVITFYCSPICKEALLQRVKKTVGRRRTALAETRSVHLESVSPALSS